MIVSLDTLVGERLFARLCGADTPAYDLVVFDEAHKLSASTENRRTRKTLRYQLAEALAGCAAPGGDFAGLPWSSRHLLLLTGKPLYRQRFCDTVRTWWRQNVDREATADSMLEAVLPEKAELAALPERYGWSAAPPPAGGKLFRQARSATTRYCSPRRR